MSHTNKNTEIPMNVNPLTDLSAVIDKGLHLVLGNVTEKTYRLECRFSEIILLSGLHSFSQFLARLCSIP